jgi:aspartyl-tRNA(Asn)/glutamyl-tRNA(Gln) amidotransferase subunit C
MDPEMKEDLARIVAYVDRLREVDIEGVEPFATAIDPVTRPDRHVEGLDPEEALKGAPDRRGPQFRVRRVLERGR